MNDFQKNMTIFYIILLTTAIVLIFTGVFLEYAFEFFKITPSKTILTVFKSAFIISGVADIILLIYAKNKLNS